ncbi:MAG TPA: hypothetical protein VGB13_00485 [Candidatus Krumholzibacteria bacterium]
MKPSILRMFTALVFALAVTTRAQAAHGQECSPWWAVQLLQRADADAKQAEEARQNAMERIAACPNRAELFLRVGEIGEIGRIGHTSGGGGGHTAGGGARGRPSLSPDTWGLLLSRLKAELIADIDTLQRECTGGFRGCPPKRIKAWLKKLSRFLAMVQAEGVPAKHVQDVDELFRVAAAASPEFRLAQAIAEALEGMSPAQKERLRKKYPKLIDELSGKNSQERVRILLEQERDLRSLLNDIVASGTGRVVTSGRRVIVAGDLAPLAELEQSCKEDTAVKLGIYFNRLEPPGIRYYPVGSEGATLPSVCARVTPVASGPDHPLCTAKAGERCIEVAVRGWLEPDAPDASSPNCHENASAPQPSLRATLVSPPFTDCPEHEVLETLAGDVYESFSARLRADDAWVDQASLIQPDCVEVVADVASAWDALGTPLKQGGTRSLHLQGSGWESFGSELREALQSTGVFSDVTLGDPGTEASGLSFDWRGPEPGAQTQEAVVTVSWHRGEALPPAQLTFVALERDDCQLTSLTFQRTVAARTTLWLLGKHFPPRNAATPDPARPASKKKPGKDWALAPLAILLAGLPQLADGRSDNDARGVVLAGLDLVLVTTAAMFVLLSVNERNAVAQGEEGASIAKANRRLKTGLFLGGGVFVPRLVSVVW